jgi:hypothetical protein
MVGQRHRERYGAGNPRDWLGQPHHPGFPRASPALCGLRLFSSFLERRQKKL